MTKKEKYLLNKLKECKKYANYQLQIMGGDIIPYSAKIWKICENAIKKIKESRKY